MENPQSVNLDILDDIISRTSETVLNNIVTAYQQ
nr:MAG TPA: hypothetical protein [Bacteriophage sp.]